MPEPDDVNAQLVMKRKDGTSILDAKSAVRAETVGKFDVSEDREADIRQRVEALGFTVTAGDRNTLSISGPRELFAKIFGFEAAGEASGEGTHATKIPPELADGVADVIVTPPPEFFP